MDQNQQELRDSEAIAEAIELHKKQQKEEDDAAPPIVKVLKPFALVELPQDILLKVLADAGPRSVLAQVCKDWGIYVQTPKMIPVEKSFEREVVEGLEHALSLKSTEDVFDAIATHMNLITANDNRLRLKNWPATMRDRLGHIRAEMENISFTSHLFLHLMRRGDVSACYYLLGYKPIENWEPRLTRTPSLHGFATKFSDPFDMNTPQRMQKLSYESLNERSIREYGLTDNLYDLQEFGGLSTWYLQAEAGMLLFYGAKRFDLARLLHHNAWRGRDMNNLSMEKNDDGYSLIFRYDSSYINIISPLNDLIYYVSQLPKLPYYAETEHFLEHDVVHQWTVRDLESIYLVDGRTVDDPLIESAVRSTKNRIARVFASDPSAAKWQIGRIVRALESVEANWMVRYYHRDDYPVIVRRLIDLFNS